jgi:hypothetical protein
VDGLVEELAADQPAPRPTQLAEAPR